MSETARPVEAPPVPLRPMELLRIGPFAILYLNATVIGLSVMA